MKGKVGGRRGEGEEAQNDNVEWEKGVGRKRE
jgi:hypothetical protein